MSGKYHGFRLVLINDSKRWSLIKGTLQILFITLLAFLTQLWPIFQAHGKSQLFRTDFNLVFIFHQCLYYRLKKDGLDCWNSLCSLMESTHVSFSVNFSWCGLFGDRLISSHWSIFSNGVACWQRYRRPQCQTTKTFKNCFKRAIKIRRQKLHEELIEFLTLKPNISVKTSTNSESDECDTCDVGQTKLHFSALGTDSEPKYSINCLKV